MYGMHDTNSGEWERCSDVAVIGAGFAGSMVAFHLLQDPGARLTVTLIERGERFGRGVAYGTRSPAHLLNVPAAKMGAVPDEPDQFLRWLESNPDAWARVGLSGVGGGSFIPRALYGDYIQSLLVSCERHGNLLERVRGETTDVQPLLDGTYRIHLASGATLRTRYVVLATGNFPPGDPPLRDRRFHGSERYLRNPWSIEDIGRLATPGDILVLGSGLTSLDLLQTLGRQKQEGVMHVLSRRGLFPQPHRASPAWNSSMQTEDAPARCRSLLRRVRQEVSLASRAGFDWRAVIDSLRPHTQRLWGALSLPEQRRFLRHLRAYWESHRHRVAPEVLAIKTELERAGRLRCHRGRLIEIIEEELYLRVTFSRPGHSQRTTIRATHVINCTGPECNYQHLDHPLVVQLFARGLIRPDPLFLGLDVASNGAVRNVRGEPSAKVFTLGSSRKGSLMETTAVPEIRVQARELAQQIIREISATNREGSFADVLPDPSYAFEI